MDVSKISPFECFTGKVSEYKIILNSTFVRMLILLGMKMKLRPRGNQPSLFHLQKAKHDNFIKNEIIKLNEN